MAHQEYKKNWDIWYRNNVSILNIFQKNWKLTIFKELNRVPQNWRWSPKNSQIFKYSQYWWCREITWRQLLRLNLLWEVELGFRRQEIALMQIPINFLTIPYRIQKCEFSILADISIFLWASLKNGSISNIPGKFDCPSILTCDTYIDSWHVLTSLGSKSSPEVQKTHSHCEIEWLLKF